MPNRAQIRQHTQTFLQTAKDRTQPIEMPLGEIEITVNPGVFPPATDTRLLVSQIHLQPGQRFIDVTTGSGGAAVVAGLQGATGYAIDINPAAVENAQQNINRHDVAVEAVLSDLFAEVPDEQFDLVLANGPFFEGEIIDPMDYACFGARQFIENLLAQTATRLKPTGKLQIVMSAWSELDHFLRTAAEQQLLAKQVATRRSDDGQREYLLFEVWPQKV